MPRPTVIEVAGEAVGIVVPDAEKVRFVAVKYPVWSLDDRIFGSADDARRAARDLVARDRAIRRETDAGARRSA